MIYDEYEEYVLKYRKEYGEKTLVLLECGSFYEIYNGGEGLINMREIGDILNIQVSRRNKQVLEVSRVNYEMAGFPAHALKKFLQILVQHMYTVVIVSQITPPPNPKRGVTEIVSPGTYVDGPGYMDTNYLMVLYLEENESHKNGMPLLSMGLAVMDVGTGKNYVLETTSEHRDITFPLDEAYRIMMIYRPREILLMSDALQHIQEQKVRDHLELDKYCVHDFLGKMDPAVGKLAFQTEVLKKAFPKTGLLSPIEYVGLERKPHALVSYIKMLQFAFQHRESILQGLPTPELLEEDQTMILSYNCGQQLDIVHEKKSTYSLLHILNHCKTAMGRRYFRQRLLTPSKQASTIQAGLDKIDACLQDHLYERIRQHLAQVYDMERLFRRWAMEIIHPHELGNLSQSLEAVLVLSGMYFEPLAPSMEEGVRVILHRIHTMFDMERIPMYNRENIDGKLFLRGVNPDMDELVDHHATVYSYFQDALHQLNRVGEFFRLESTDKDGYYFVTTSKRLAETKVKVPALEVAGKSVFLKDCTTKVLTSSVKLTHPVFERLNHEIVSLERKMASIATNMYKEFLACMHAVYSPLVCAVNRYVMDADYVCANALNVTLFRLSKPVLKDATKSFARMKGLRHLIVEHVQPDIPYVANDVTIGIEGEDGMLLYGINSAGKSSLMKSIGLSIIMAQAGMYVPCLDMEFAPYDKIFTRIFSSDDIFKGHSTFTKEILELRNILKRATSCSLVIGDELCSGTESISAVSIVSAGICTLAKRGCSFVFATHLHDLVDVPEVQGLPNVHVYHLSVMYEESTKKLVYDRKLQPGNGSSMYGIEVCKSLDLDPEFLLLANRIRQGYMNIHLPQDKPSHFNRNVLVSTCGICHCHMAEEVHHIKHQADADKDGYIGTHHKNAKFNLIPLCTSCHDKVHAGQLEVQGYVQTSDGVEVRVKSCDTSLSTDATIKDAYDTAMLQLGKKKDVLVYLQQKLNISAYKIQQAIKRSSSSLSAFS